MKTRKEIEMAINVSSLPSYVDEHSQDLIIDAALGAKTIEHIDVLPNVKSKTALNYLDVDVEFGDGDECGFEAQGDDTLSQRILEVKTIKVNKAWCQRKLRDKWVNHELLYAAGREKFPFVEKFIEATKEAINDKLDKVIWQGEQVLDIKGLLEWINEENVVAKASIASGSTATAYIEGAYGTLPVKALQKGNCKIFVSPALFKQYVSELNASCCANRPIYDASSNTMSYVGDSRVTIVGVGGLEGIKCAVAAYEKALVYGTDIEGSENIFDLWFSQENRDYRLEAIFNGGTQIRHTDMVAIASTNASISATLNQSTSSNPATSIVYGSKYVTKIVPKSGYAISAVAVTMGGSTVSGAYDATTGLVTVPSVSGNLAIVVTTAGA